MRQERQGGLVGQSEEPGLAGKKTGGRAKRIIGDGAVLALFGLAAWGVFDIGGRIRDHFDSQQSVSGRPEKPQFVYNEEHRIVPNDREFKELIHNSLGAYVQWENFGRNNLQKLLNDTQPQETAKLLEEVGKNFVLEGVNILRIAWLVGHIQDQVMVDFPQENLWINDYHFDLKNRFQWQLASAWIQTKVMRLEKQLSIDLKKKNEDIEEMPLEAENLGEELGMLEWLMVRNLDITMGEETFAFFPRDEMVMTARVFQAVDRLNLDVPRQVEWCAGECLRNIRGKDVIVNEDGTMKVERKGKTGGIPTFKEGVRLRNSNLVASLVHEIGHLLSDKSSYLQRFVQIRGYEGVAPHISERWKHVSLYAMADKQEDFAETFMNYMMDGEGFRALLAELKVRDPGSWQVLTAKYNFMKDEVWQGLEFAVEGRVFNMEMEAKEREFAGILWNVETRSVIVKPTPEVWPEKRRIFKNFPVLVDDEIKNVVVDFRHDPKTNSYEVYVSPMGLVSKINLRPIGQDGRIAVRTDRYEFGLARFVEKGTQEDFEIVSGLTDFNRGWRLAVESFSPIEIGQERKIFDNESKWSDRYVALRVDPRLVTDYDPRVKDGMNMQIIDGPLIIHDWYTDREEFFWKVTLEDVTKGSVSGWVSQRWIGREVE